MRKTAIVAALILAGVGGWAASTTDARVATSSVGGGMDPFQMTLSAKQLPAQHYDDFSLVFH